MKKKDTEEYRGYIIEKVGKEILIFDKNKNFCKRIEFGTTKSAKYKIDQIIKESR
jgi:hypothetical protein